MTRFLLYLARHRLSRGVLGWWFTHMSFAIPVKRLRETDTLIAFHHPQPSYGLHILLMPKGPFATLLDLPAAETTFLRELIETVQSLVREFHLEHSGYRFLTNGGAFQEVPHLHFHLVAGDVRQT